MTRDGLLAELDRLGVSGDEEIEFQVSDIYGNSERCEVNLGRRAGAVDCPQIKLILDEHRLTVRSRARYD